jgi:hypothetical protein
VIGAVATTAPTRPRAGTAGCGCRGRQHRPGAVLHGGHREPGTWLVTAPGFAARTTRTALRASARSRVALARAARA